jgi:hypothetical protein
MKKSWTTLLVLIILSSCLVSLVSGAESINITYPENVIVGEIFEINLTLIDFSEDIYDIKIDIYNETNNSQRLSEIFNGDSWQSTYNYFNNATNTSEALSSIFQLNITKNYGGTANITIKIKNGTTRTFENYQINITPQTPQDPPEEDTNEDIYLKLKWDEDEIINGKEFEIKVKAYNLENQDYNLKIWIKFEDNDTKISERYDEELEEWKSGNYYVDEFFSGDGNKTKNIDLRIKEDYEDYQGDDVEICFKLEDEPDTEECENIEILEKEEESEEEDLVAQQDENTQTTQETITSNVITLGSSSKTEDLKEQNNIIYQSKTELIKKYTIIAFAFFCVGLSALLVFNKLN